MLTSLAVLALLAGSPGLPNEPVARPGSEMEAAPPAEKKICRRVEITGSIMPARRLCQSAAAWHKMDAERDANASAIMDMRNRGTLKHFGE